LVLPWPFSLIEDLVRGLWNWISNVVDSAIKRLWNWIQPAISGIKNFVSQCISGISTWISNAISTIQQNLSGLLSSIGSYFSQTWQAISNLGSWIVREVSKSFDWFIGNIVKPLLDWLKGLGKLLMDWAKGVIGWIITNLRYIGEGIWKTVKGFMTWFGDIVYGIVADVVNRVREVLLPGSPPKEIEESVGGFTLQLHDYLMSTYEELAKSPVNPAAAQAAAVQVATKLTTMAATAEAAGAAADSAHPTKNLQIRETIKSVLALFGIMSIIRTPFVKPYEYAIGKPFEYWLAERFRPELISVEQAIEQVHRGIISVDDYMQIGAWHGLRDEYLNHLLEASYQLLPVEVIRVALWYDAISVDRAKSELKRHRWRDEDIEIFFNTLYKYPGVADAAKLLWRGLIDEAEYKRILKAQGIREEYHDRLVELTKLMPDLEDAAKLLWRGLIDEAEYKRVLRIKGIDPAYHDRMLQLTKLLPGIDQATKMLWRRLIDEDKYRDILKAHGYDPAWHDNLLEIAREVPGIAEATRLLWRGLINEDEYRNILRAHGIKEDYIDGLVELTKLIPPASDLINFVVREAFPLEELPPAPPEFVKYMRMQGYSEEWCKAYWWAHWKLPAPEQLFRAMQRGIISEEEMKKYIVWHDYWDKPRPGISKSDQEIMLELSWDIPGRIDLRWMWEWGIIDDKQLEEWLIKTGMNPKYAKDVMKGWMANLLREERMKVFTAYMEAFINGYVTEEELRSKLAELGIVKQRADLYIEAAKKERENEVKKDQVTAILEAYRKGLIDKVDAINLLDGILVSTEVRDALLMLIEARMSVEKKLQQKETRLTKTDIRDALKKGIISEAKARELLTKLGYTEFDIDVLFSLWLGGEVA